MKHFYWSTIGAGKINLILLSGWGLNSKIWFLIINKLKFFFKCHLIDLPGIGQNQKLRAMTIDEIIHILYHNMPKNAIWLGWSIGGLIASYFALSYPEHASSVISVSSSPCFIKKKVGQALKKILQNNFILI